MYIVDREENKEYKVEKGECGSWHCPDFPGDTQWEDIISLICYMKSAGCYLKVEPEERHELIAETVMEMRSYNYCIETALAWTLYQGTGVNYEDY